MHVTCQFCHHRFQTRSAEKVKPGRSDNQRRSRDQEDRSASRNKARRQPGSGSVKAAKGDVKKDGVIRGECKFTRAKSFSLKLAELMKLEDELEPGELPYFEIEFQGVYPPKRYVVLPDEHFQFLRSLDD